MPPLLQQSPEQSSGHGDYSKPQRANYDNPDIPHPSTNKTWPRHMTLIGYIAVIIAILAPAALLIYALARCCKTRVKKVPLELERRCTLKTPSLVQNVQDAYTSRSIVNCKKFNLASRFLTFSKKKKIHRGSSGRKGRHKAMLFNAEKYPYHFYQDKINVSQDQALAASRTFTGINTQNLQVRSDTLVESIRTPPPAYPFSLVYPPSVLPEYSNLRLSASTMEPGYYVDADPFGLEDDPFAATPRSSLASNSPVEQRLKAPDTVGCADMEGMGIRYDHCGVNGGWRSSKLSPVSGVLSYE